MDRGIQAVGDVRGGCYGAGVSERAAVANQALTRRPGRPRAVASADLVNVCVGVLLANPEGLTTYQIVDLLEGQPSLPASSRQGRFKQAERALRSSIACERGVVAVAPEGERRRTGRPPSKLWRLAPAAQRAA
jgi:hypothetical protein